MRRRSSTRPCPHDLGAPRARRRRRAALALALAASLGTAAGCGSSSTTTATSAPATAPAATTPATSTPASTTAASASGLSGNWAGHYEGAYSGTFALNWLQSGSTLAGHIRLSTPGVTVPVHGTLSGSQIQFGTVGSVAITYTGTVSGSSMSGSYQTPGGGGSWSAHKL
jgi:hypothetical protein